MANDYRPTMSDTDILRQAHVSRYTEVVDAKLSLYFDTILH